MNAYTVRIKLADNGKTVTRSFHGSTTEDAIQWGQKSGRVMCVFQVVAMNRGKLEIL